MAEPEYRGRRWLNAVVALAAGPALGLAFGSWKPAFADISAPVGALAAAASSAGGGVAGDGTTSLTTLPTPPPTTKMPITLPPVTLPPLSLPVVALPPVTVPPLTAPPVTVPPVDVQAPLVTLPSLPLGQGTEAPAPVDRPVASPAESSPAPSGRLVTDLPARRRAALPATSPPAPALAKPPVTGPLPLRLRQAASETAQQLSFPLGLAAAILAFLVLQPRLDRDDPSVAHQGTSRDDDLLGFS